MSSQTVAPTDRSGLSPRVLSGEILLVLGVSLGASAVYALVRFVAAVSAGPLAGQQAQLNVSRAPGRPGLDLALQLLDVAFGVVPALLALHLLGRTDPPAGRYVGLDRSAPLRDVGVGVALAAMIGVPGLALYLLAHALGLNLTVSASGLPTLWWTVPVLLLSAVQNAVLEEIVVVGYLLRRLERLGWTAGRALLASAVLRGLYHLYQGIGGFVGNLIMGLVFGRLFQRHGRLLPLVIAHALLDVVAFIGYAMLRGKVGWLP